MPLMKSKKSFEESANFEDPDFSKLIPRRRPTGAIHPESTNKFSESKKPVKSIEVNQHSSYGEFAWEFLRRNRFYQALVERKRYRVPETQWGYKWNPAVSRSHGLVRLKPHWESYQKGEPPSWLGLGSFAEQLPLATSMEYISVEVKLRPGQIAVVFDVGNLIAGQSPWQKQADAVEQRLKLLCKNDFDSEPIGGKPDHRSVLLRRLKMFDMLSAGKTLAFAADALDLTYKKKKTGKKVNSPIEYFRLPSKQKPITTAYDDATEAYNLVYRHGYMNLLRGDDFYIIKGNHFVPLTLLDNNGEVPEDW